LLWFVVVVFRIGFVVSQKTGEFGSAVAEGGNADRLGLDGALVPGAAEPVNGLLNTVGNWRRAENKLYF